MSNINQIWLAPICHEDGDGRLWCQDDVWGDDCGCGIAQHSAVRYVLASDYDRDTQALKVEVERLGDECEGCPMATAEELRIERDALRAQVEAMRELLTGVCDYADDLLTDVKRAWSYCGSTGADEVHKDADYLAARAALQAKP